MPDFAVPAADGTTWRLKDALGRKLVLYFYPKDMTTGCAAEARAFRDLHAAFARAGTGIAGISRDPPASHLKFAAKEALPFTLLSDQQETVCRLFDVIREKSLYGRRFLGIERSTFLLDAAGVLRREWRRVKVQGHAEEVLEAAKSL
ncbi:MAG TPA: peroxiredoxin [Steroidobacteraceae bacterium]|nr:peroxiredoxin [Steroidobacteraceae bacterium]